MSDDLQDRIETILGNAAAAQVQHLRGRIDVRAMAKALIRELQIDIEDGECNYCHAMLPGCRYSTWKADDE